MTLTLPILRHESAANLRNFIAFWSTLYAYKNDERAKKYKKVEQSVLSEEDLKDLYEWKNGMVLSAAKTQGLETKILRKIKLINALKSAEHIDVAAFLAEFKEVSAVWKIFLLHIIKPNVYPIYDQHVHRAYLFIQQQSTDGITTNMGDARKLAFYFEAYLPFVQTAGIDNLKQMDEAFFAFGQFIHSKKQKMLFL